MRTTYLHILLIFSLLISTNGFAQGNFYATNVTVATPSPNNCSVTQVDVRTYLGCRNFINNGYTFTILNDTINIEVSYSSSPICLGALSQPVFNVMLDTLPARNYTIAATALLDAIKVNTLYSSVSVANCCPTTSNLMAAFSAPDSVFCEGELIAFLNLSTTSAQTFQWYINNVPFSTFNHPTTDSLPAGNYAIRLEADSAFCSDDTTINIRVAQKPTVTLGPDTTICQGTSFTLIPSAPRAVSYFWQDSTTADSIIISQAGWYILTITDSLGCTQSDSIQVTTAVCTGLNDSKTFGEKIYLFPNPVSKWEGVTISANETTGPINYQLMDIQGRKVQNGYMNLSPSDNYLLSTNDFEKGIYFLEMTNEEGTVTTKKLVVR